jgi:hypothetical protein
MMTEVFKLRRNELFKDVIRPPRPGPLEITSVNNEPKLTLDSFLKYLEWAADGEEAKLELKRVLYGFVSERNINDPSESSLGTQILDLFYRLALAENFKGIVSKNHMSPFLWYVKSYREFQIGLFQRKLSTLDVENLVIQQISDITVPDVNSLESYKGKEGKYDIISLNHDCLYNAITLAVCARKAQFLADIYTPSWRDSPDKKLDLSHRDERRVFFEQQTIAALGKAEALYGMYMGFRISELPVLSRKDVNFGNLKSNELNNHFKEMFLNYIVNDAPAFGWHSVDHMLDEVAPKMFLINQRIYKEPKIPSVESMRSHLVRRLNSKVTAFKHEYYIHASDEGRKEFKGLATVSDVKQRADEMDENRKKRLEPGGLVRVLDDN